MATISTLSNLAVSPAVVTEKRIDYVGVLAAIREVFSGKEDAELPAVMKEAGLSTASKAGKALKGSALVPSLRAQLDKLDEEGIVRVAKALGMPLSYLQEEQEVEAEQTQELPVLAAEPVASKLAFVPQSKEYPPVGQVWGRALVEKRIQELGVTVPEDRVEMYAESVNAEAIILRRFVKQMDEMDPRPAFSQAAATAYDNAEAEVQAWSEKQEKTEEKPAFAGEVQAPVAKDYPYELKFSWGTALMLNVSSARVTISGHTVLLSAADIEPMLMSATKEQVEVASRVVREKAWLAAKASGVKGVIKGLFMAYSGLANSTARQSVALLDKTLDAAIEKGDKEVAQKIVVNILSMAKTMKDGRQVIDPKTVSRVANDWGIHGVPAPEQKKSESQKPAGNVPAPVVSNKPASEPAKAPVEAQKELPVSNSSQQTVSAPVSTPVTEPVVAPVAEVTPPAVEAPVAPASEEVTQQAPASEPEAPKTEADAEAPTEPVAEVKKPASMADCWKILVGMTPTQRNATLEMVMTTAEGQLKDKKLMPHLRNLVGKIKALISKGKDFASAKQAVKNANKNLLAWITSEYTAHTEEINGLLIKAIETGLSAQEPVGNSPDAANTDEPANTPANEENDMSSQPRINMHNANPVTETVLEGTVEGEPTKEAPKVEKSKELSKEEKAAKAKADKEAKKAAAKAKKENTPKVASTVKVGLMVADISVRRFCAPMIPAQKETVKALLNELTTACGESDALVNPNGKGLPIEVLRNTMLQAMEASVKAREGYWAPVKAFEAAATTDDQNRQGVAMRNKAVADWGANQSNYMAKEIEEAFNAHFTGDEGLAKKQATMMACQYFLGRNETVQKEGRFVTEAGAKAIAEKAKELKAKLDLMKPETAEGKAEKARLAKGLAMFAAIKDDKSYRALRVKLANAKAALARATTAKLEDAPMMAKLEGQVIGLQKIGDLVDSILRGSFELKTWDLWATGTTSSRDMKILVEAILNVKFASTAKDEAGKDVVRMDSIAGSSEELRDTVGKLAAALLVKVLYENTQLDLEVREVMEAIKSPKLLVQAAAKPGFRGYARTTAWTIYAGGVYVTLKTAAVLNWAAAPLKAAFYAAKAAGLYGFGFIAEDKEGNRKAVSEALADAKDLIIGFFVLPKDMVVNGVKAGWSKVKSLFGGEKKADVTVTDADKAKTPDQGKEEGAMNTISEKSKSVVSYIKTHKAETAGVVAGGVAAGVGSAMLLGTGVLATAGAVVVGAAVVAGGIWAVKKIAGWFSGRKAEKVAKVETAKAPVDAVDASAASASL